jgi:hypothetical protein
MTTTLFTDFVKDCKGTFLEEYRDSNFPGENRIGKDPYKDLCRELVETWDETIKTPGSFNSRRVEFCAKAERIVSNARARLAGC